MSVMKRFMRSSELDLSIVGIECVTSGSQTEHGQAHVY